jgi:pimeloyl-ACP methyl ester carboxylesterase
MLLHGFPEFWWAWRHMIGPLAERGFHVIAPDMRGYNDSDVPSGIAEYHTSQLAADVIALANALEIERFSLAGHDWGGLVAWAVAARSPGRLERLIIMDAPHADVWTRYALRHPAQALRSSYVGWFQLPLLPEMMMRAFDFALLRSTLVRTAAPDAFQPWNLDIYAAAWAKPGRLTAMVDYYRALRLPGSVQLGRIEVPTLIVWGAKDRFLDNALAAESACRCSSARAVLLENATHWLHLEQPEEVVDVWTDFLGEQGR